jgi:large subunit ribosomal protein L29
MKIAVLRDMTRDELMQKKADLNDEQFNLQMRRTLKPLDNPLRLREIRRDMARIETILNEDVKGLRKIAESGVDILKQK